MKEISKEDLKILETAKDNLENVGLIMQGLNFVGDRIETLISKIPQKQKVWLSSKTNGLLLSIVKINLKTMHKNKAESAPLNKTYKTVVAASGVGFGFFGAVGFVADLTISTKFMMRSIMDIARSKGEDLNTIEAQLSCLEVFALGGKSKEDDGLDTSYYATRIALSSSVKLASAYVTENGVAKTIEKLLVSGPFLKLVGKIASRFETKVLEQFVTKAPPVIGAVGGGAINLIFTHHFQKIAKAHFTIRHLERKYGEEIVRKKYEEIEVNLFTR